MLYDDDHDDDDGAAGGDNDDYYFWGVALDILGYSPVKMTEILKNTPKGTRILFCGRGYEFFLTPLKSTISEMTN